MWAGTGSKQVRTEEAHCIIPKTKQEAERMRVMSISKLLYIYSFEFNFKQVILDSLSMVCQFSCHGSDLY